MNPNTYGMVDEDYSRDSLLPKFAIDTLKDRYLIDGETSPQEAFARAAKAFADDIPHARRLYDYASKLWFMFSTPILSNGGTKRGMPISCFLQYVPDSREGLMDHYTESAWLASAGGGLGGYWGAIRSDGTNTSKGSKSNGSIPFMKVMDSLMLAFNQGATRRGAYAAYTDISHPEVEEFIRMRKPAGDSNRKCLNLHNAINVSDAFMDAVMKDLPWPLIDPHSRETKKVVSARELWKAILETRVATGEPYICFIDTANDLLPEAQKLLGLRINHTNLCSEIYLPTGPDRTAVCCLSSVNLEKFDEWKDHPTFIEDLVRMLDNVLTFFIENAPPEAWKAVNSAKNERAIGLGAMGFHSYLQKHMVPFETAMASSMNRRLFKHIKERALEASKKLATERGEAPDMKGTGLRFSHLLAVAPNASSSIICGNTSPSIEPHRANAYTHKTMSGSFLVKNKYLEQQLEKIGKNTDEVWTSIITNRGSIQHLDFIPIDVREVFRTAMELNQLWIIDHAASRQEYICQGQSVNLFFPANVTARELNAVHVAAWKKKLKGLYYLRSETIQRPENIAKKIERQVMDLTIGAPEDSCLSCSG